MENVYIISDYSAWLERLIQDLKLESSAVLDYEEMDEHWEYDHWVLTHIPNDAKALVIPIELGQNNATSIDGLRIGMHLRLMPYEFSARNLPLIFVSNREHWQINQLARNSRDKNHFDYLIGTKGTDVTGPVAEDILAVIKNLEPLGPDEYKPDFYDHIKILPSDKVGKHSLANIWGAFKLAQITGHLDALLDNVELLKRQKDLYFKYKNALVINGLRNNGTVTENKIIQSSNKKILLIDDEANKGWNIVLKVLFKDSQFISIEREEHEPFSAFYARARETALRTSHGNQSHWDLILLDLRLDDQEDLGEAAFKTAREYSGSKLLEEIKKINPGTQVIMFTASNKAWNMQELLTMGANGFYIKESPEYDSQETLNLSNYSRFETQVIQCFNKSYLKRLYEMLLPVEQLCKAEINKSPKSYSLTLTKGTIQKIVEQIFVSKKLLNDYPFELKWAYITIVLMIEDIVNECYYGDPDQSVCVDLLTKVKCNFLKEGKRRLAITPTGQAYTSGEYIVTHADRPWYDQSASRVPFNFRLTCLLHFKYNMPLDDSLFRFFDVYKLRSDSVAHSGNKLVREADVSLSLELLSILIK